MGPPDYRIWFWVGFAALGYLDLRLRSRIVHEAILGPQLP
jgi:hypothetical protein